MCNLTTSELTQIFNYGRVDLVEKFIHFIFFAIQTRNLADTATEDNGIKFKDFMNLQLLPCHLLLPILAIVIKKLLILPHEQRKLLVIG